MKYLDQLFIYVFVCLLVYVIYLCLLNIYLFISSVAQVYFYLFDNTFPSVLMNSLCVTNNLCIDFLNC